MGYQGECITCGWVGAHHESHGAAEGEAAQHAGDCPAKKLILSCAAGCVAGSKIRGGVWVTCENCKGTGT